MINLMVFMIVVISCRFSSTDVKTICPFWETLLLFAEKSMSEAQLETAEGVQAWAGWWWQR
jgi:hypothetical protein